MLPIGSSRTSAEHIFQLRKKSVGSGRCVGAPLSAECGVGGAVRRRIVIDVLQRYLEVWVFALKNLGDYPFVRHAGIFGINHKIAYARFLRSYHKRDSGSEHRRGERLSASSRRYGIAERLLNNSRNSNNERLFVVCDGDHSIAPVFIKSDRLVNFKPIEFLPLRNTGFFE